MVTVIDSIISKKDNDAKDKIDSLIVEIDDSLYVLPMIEKREYPIEQDLKIVAFHNFLAALNITALAILKKWQNLISLLLCSLSFLVEFRESIVI